jgi:hypothetical protein
VNLLGAGWRGNGGEASHWASVVGMITENTDAPTLVRSWYGGTPAARSCPQMRSSRDTSGRDFAVLVHPRGTLLVSDETMIPPSPRLR